MRKLQNRQTVVTVGNFDGVHVGHQRLWDKVTRLAEAEKLRGVVLTFDPHPAAFFGGDADMPLLTTAAEKRALVEAQGLEYEVVPFTAAFAALSPAAFFAEVLRPLGCRHLVIGEDFRFGQKGMGDAAAAVQIGAACGVAVHVMPDFLVDGERISSSRIRGMVSACRLSEAEALLGRPYHITGTVVRGEQRGRLMGYPTLNLAPPVQKLLPPDGVYITQTTWANGAQMGFGLTNIGTNPTFGAQARVVETHLLDVDLGHTKEMYGEEATVSFLKFRRGEKTFASMEELQAAIDADAVAAQSFIAVPHVLDAGESM